MWEDEADASLTRKPFSSGSLQVNRDYCPILGLCVDQRIFNDFSNVSEKRSESEQSMTYFFQYVIIFV